MSTLSNHIEVAVALPISQTFVYHVPKDCQDAIMPGTRVLVPFGRRHVAAYVLGTGNPEGLEEVKSIGEVLDATPLFPGSTIPFLRWVANYYFYALGEVFKTALPAGLNPHERSQYALTEAGANALDSGALSSAERQMLKTLARRAYTYRYLVRGLEENKGRKLLRALEKRDLLTKITTLQPALTRTKTERYVRLHAQADLSYATLAKLSPVRQKIISALQRQEDLALKTLQGTVPTAPRLIKPMAEAGLIEVLHKPVYRDPFGDAIMPEAPLPLTDEQSHVMSDLLGAVGKGFATYLLSGVTGSGKTEVYLQLATEVIAQGYSVLVLVPEIALITQMEHRFRARFGDQIAVLHSGLSAGERLDQWMRILNREAPIAIGARSAIFAPLTNLGLIVVDEEHDTSYKQERGLRYNARDLAVARAKFHGALALLGSATPSFQSYHNARTGKFHEVTLNNRIEKSVLPEVAVVDLCRYRDHRGLHRFLTPELQTAIRQTLDRQEQVLLFINRRGFATFPICSACGEPIKCNNCDITLTLHKSANAYRCHYCGYSRAAVACCPLCGSPKIHQLGLGTEKIESAVQALYPEARVARMDRDTTTRKGALLRLLKGLKDRSTDILIGTQIVAKGHDFPGITLVGIICADLSMSFPDFRAGERTFQLLAQVAGRAGRGDRPGQVILQTYNPDHFSITSARKQDFRRYYAQEIRFRQELNYPPFTRLVQLKIAGKDKARSRQHAQALGQRCHRLQQSRHVYRSTIEVMGPIEAPLGRVARRFRWQILLKGHDVKWLHGFTRQLLADSLPLLTNPNITVAVDVDPLDLM
jgi:primosomal protein N' (replication factor Y)